MASLITSQKDHLNDMGQVGPSRICEEWNGGLGASWQPVAWLIAVTQGGRKWAHTISCQQKVWETIGIEQYRELRVVVDEQQIGSPFDQGASPFLNIDRADSGNHWA